MVIGHPRSSARSHSIERLTSNSNLIKNYEDLNIALSRCIRPIAYFPKVRGQLTVTTRPLSGTICRPYAGTCYDHNAHAHFRDGLSSVICRLGLSSTHIQNLKCLRFDYLQGRYDRQRKNM